MFVLKLSLENLSQLALAFVVSSNFILSLLVISNTS